MAIECNISVFEFWSMTYGEVIDSIRAFNRKHINELKEKSLFDYTLAGLIGKHIEVRFCNNEDAVLPSLVQAYDFLYPEEKKVQDELKAKAEMEIWKQKMIRFAENHNRKRGEER